MSEPTGKQEPAFDAVDDALRTYPLAAPPPRLMPAVLARIRTLAPAPRFRLAWLDYALSLFIAGMVGLGLLAWQSLSPQNEALAALQVRLVIQQLGAAPRLWPEALAGALLGLMALLAAAGLFALRGVWAPRAQGD